MEDGEAPEVVAWVAAQNERTRAVLDALPGRTAWHGRLLAHFGASMSRSCRVAGELVFALERGGGAAQYALVVRDARSPGEPARVLLDPAGITADATASIDWYHPSHRRAARGLWRLGGR